MPTDDELFDLPVPPEDLIPEEFRNGRFVVSEEDEEEETEEDEEVAEPLVFDDSYKEDFKRLTTLGKLTATFKWAGQSFKIRTITTDTMLEAGVLHKPFVGTVSDVRAFSSLMVAACLETANGKKLPIPADDTESLLECRYRYVTSHYYPWTIDAIYDRYIQLEDRVEEIIQAMGKA